MDDMGHRLEEGGRGGARATRRESGRRGGSVRGFDSSSSGSRVCRRGKRGNCRWARAAEKAGLGPMAQRETVVIRREQGKSEVRMTGGSRLSVS